MTEYKGKIVTMHLDANGTRFSKEALENIAHQAIDNIPVRFNFSGEPIGRLKSLVVEEDDSVSAVFAIDRVMLLEHYFVVPGGIVEELEQDIDGQRVITKFKLTELSITNMPADPTLPEIK